MSSDKNFLKNLKAGDPVLVNNRLAKVDHITPTGIIVVDGIKYDPNNGWSKGSNTWNHSFLYEATEPAIKEYKERQFISKVKRKFSEGIELTFEQAVEISKIIGIK